MKLCHTITHGEDPDGLSAMAAVMDYCEHKQLHAGERLFTTYAELPKALDSVAKQESGECVITDLGPSGNPEILEPAVKRVIEAHDVLWIDHHTGSWDNRLAEYIQENCRVILDAEKSAGEIAVDVLGVQSEIVRELARIARIHDCNLKENPLYARAEEIQKAIMLARKNKLGISLLELTEMLRKGEFEGEFVEVVNNQYEIVIAGLFDAMKQKLKFTTLKGYKVCTVITDPILRTVVWRYLSSLSDVDIVVAIFNDGTIVVDADVNNKFIDLVGLCKSFNGGGRDGGGGWTFEGEQLDLFRLDPEAYIFQIYGYISAYITDK